MMKCSFPGVVGVAVSVGALLVVAGSVQGPQETDPSRITPAMIALGDSVFHGRTGGALCYVCHGPAAKGVTGLGPSLVDKEWLNGDGSFAFIINTIESGVQKPNKFAAPMPAKGGGQLNAQQVQAAAAYVYSQRSK
jgi:mono/diheme cytochrome c family protein